MDTQRGQFVPEAEATPEMNLYENGDIVTIEGDRFIIIRVDNNEVGGLKVRGKLELRALSESDWNSEAMQMVLKEDVPRNRHERRTKEAILRKIVKRLR